MKYIIALLLIPLFGFAQDSTHTAALKDSSDKVYQLVDVMPEFPGGEQALLKYISKQCARAFSSLKEVHGKMYVEFVINEQGEVQDVKINRSVREDVDKAAIKVIQSMPKWKPGLISDRPVKVHYMLPISI